MLSVDQGSFIKPKRITLGEWLDDWLSGYVKTNCSQRTLDGYQSIIEHHLMPALGYIQLKQLYPQAIQAYYGQACEHLSSRTVYHHHRVLSQSLKYAVRQGYLGRNPAELVDNDEDLKQVMHLLQCGHFNSFEAGIFDEIIASLLNPNDPWLTLADFRSYVDAQQAVSDAYRDRQRWLKMSILNTASSGHFSTDRTMEEYNRDIWQLDS